MAVTVPPGVSPDHNAEMVASPRPTIPSSVCTRTRTNSEVACSPWAVLADRPVLSGTATGIGSMRVIFMAGLTTETQRHREEHTSCPLCASVPLWLIHQKSPQHVGRDPRHIFVDRQGRRVGDRA